MVFSIFMVFNNIGFSEGVLKFKANVYRCESDKNAALMAGAKNNISPRYLGLLGKSLLLLLLLCTKYADNKSNKSVSPCNNI